MDSIQVVSLVFAVFFFLDNSASFYIFGSTDIYFGTYTKHVNLHHLYSREDGEQRFTTRTHNYPMLEIEENISHFSIATNTKTLPPITRPEIAIGICKKSKIHLEVL